MFEKSSTCVGCLSTDRSLRPFKSFLSIKFNLFNFNEFNQLKGKLCWECQALVVKFYNFRLQLAKAKVLIRSQKEYCHTLSKLSHKTQSTYNHVYVQQENLLEKIKLEVKLDPLQCYNKNIYENEDFDADFNQEHEKEEGKLLTEEPDVKDNYNTDVKEDIESLIGVNRIVKNNDSQNPQASTSSVVKVKIENDHNEECVKKLPKLKYITQIYTDEELLKQKQDKLDDPVFKKKKYKCLSCTIEFYNKYGLDSHMVKKHDEAAGSFLCPICEIRFPNEKAMQDHKDKHNVGYKCMICKYQTPYLSCIRRHCDETHELDDVEKIHCPHCTEYFKTAKEVNQHKSKVHFVYCDLCGGKFRTRNSLRVHISGVHNTNRAFSCELCRKRFKSRSILEAHIARHDILGAAKPAYCVDCDRQYKDVETYKNHLKNSVRHKERTYPCPDCDKKYTSKGQWASHYRVYHLHIKRHKCDTCGQRFTTRYKLRSHMYSNHGLARSRDHECKICGKKFYGTATLQGHLLTHSEQRSFMCADCGSTFKQKAALYTHTRLVHKGGGKKRKKTTD